MIRTKRVSIAGLMGIVLVVSFGLAVMREATEILAGLMFLATCGVLALSVVGLACRGKAERAWWLGFALFGWGYLALAFWFPEYTPQLPTMILVETWMSNAGAPVPQPRAGGMGGGFVDGVPPSREVGHCLWSLLAAAFGGVLAHAFFGFGLNRSEDDAVVPPAPARVSWRKWLRAAAVASVSFSLVVTGALFVLRWAPVFWAGAMLLLTWGVIGIAVLGTVCNRGHRRLRWLGAALFGAGYMVLVFGSDPYRTDKPHYLVNNSLHILCLWLPPFEPAYPPSSPEMALANARIRRALDQPVSLHFPHETPLDDVLKVIVATARCADGSPLPLYVDPVGLQEAEKTMQSRVQFDMEGVPLKTSLHLILRQLGLTYEIREGLLEISCSGCNDLPYIEDPLLSVGHCLLALLAAGVGALAAPLVAGPQGQKTQARDSD